MSLETYICTLCLKHFDVDRSEGEPVQCPWCGGEVMVLDEWEQDE